MKKLFLLIPAFAFALMANATNPTITIDGDKSDWVDVPMLSEPGTWPMLKVLPAADAELGTNALVYMMENTEDFDPTWAQYPTEFIDKDYDKSTEAIAEYWAFSAMGVDYKATTGVSAGSWISFPKAMSADNKVFEIGFPATYITDLGSKFGFAMYYNSGAWYCPDRSTPAVNSFSPANGFLYKTRSYTTVAGTTNLTTANVYAHPSMGEVGEYVDFGLRDNGYDTLRWAAFPIELTQPAVYDVTTNVTTTNGWKFEFWLVDVETNAVVAHIDPPASNLSSSATSHNFGAWDLTAVPAGKYMLKVKNRTAYSKVKLNSIVLEYKGGAPVAIPGTLSFDDVILSDEAWIDKSGTVDSLLFTARGSEGHNSVNYVKWKVQVTQAGAYDFTANVYRPDGSQKYEIKVLNLDESSELISNSLTGMPTGNASISSGCVYLEEGVYTVKIRNTYDNAKSRLLSVVATCIGGAVQNMPGTTNINDAWFSPNGTRADGKIDFPNGTIQDGWAKWNVAFADGGSYKATVKVNTNSGHNYTVKLYRDKNDENPITFANGSQYSQTGSPVDLEINAQVIEAGSYIMEVVNSMQNSDAELISVAFIYSGGATVNIPNVAIPLNEAILSDGATRDAQGLHFKNSQHVEWNIHATEGLYTFAATCTSSSNYSNLTIKVKQGANELYSYTPQYTYKTTDKVISSPQWILDEGDYTLELSNPTSGNGYVTALAATAAEGYFILNDNKEDDGSIALADYDASSTRYNVLLKRTFVAGRYYTLCVPFDSYDSQLASKFGVGYEVWKMVSAEQVGDEINLNFEQIEGSDFAAGTPYIIKPTIDVENPVFSDKKIRNNTYNNVKQFAVADFVGSFYKTVIPAGESNLYLQNNELFYNANNDTPLKGTRAWIRLKQQAGNQAPARARIVLQNQVATSIDFVKDANNGTLKTIENGQLVIIKNGVRYNVMGTKIQ